MTILDRVKAVEAKVETAIEAILKAVEPAAPPPPPVEAPPPPPPTTDG